MWIWIISISLATGGIVVAAVVGFGVSLVVNDVIVVVVALGFRHEYALTYRAATSSTGSPIATATGTSSYVSGFVVMVDRH